MTNISFRIKKESSEPMHTIKKTFDLTTHTSYFWNSLIWNLCVMFHVFLSLTFNPASNWCLTITLVLHILSIDVSYSYYIYFILVVEQNKHRRGQFSHQLHIHVIPLCSYKKYGHVISLVQINILKIYLELVSPFHIYLCKIAKNVRNFQVLSDY